MLTNETFNQKENNSLEKAKKLTYTIPEASEILNISIAQTYKLANQNALPTIRLGKRILISIKKLEEFINQ